MDKKSLVAFFINLAANNLSIKKFPRLQKIQFAAQSRMFFHTGVSACVKRAGSGTVLYSFQRILLLLSLNIKERM